MAIRIIDIIRGYWRIAELHAQAGRVEAAFHCAAAARFHEISNANLKESDHV